MEGWFGQGNARKTSEVWGDMRKLQSRRDIIGVQRYNKIRRDYLQLLERQEVFWKQRAKQFWLGEGDKNTKFFHKFASVRKERNKLKRLKDEQGQWHDTDEAIKEVIVSYFNTLFCASGIDDVLPDSYRVKKVSELQNHNLLLPIMEDEVKRAVFAMHQDKSPGMDGLNPAFFQVYWDIVRNDVVLFCQRFFATGELSREVNRTLVCLIPKVKHPK